MREEEEGREVSHDWREGGHMTGTLVTHLWPSFIEDDLYIYDWTKRLNKKEEKDDD